MKKEWRSKEEHSNIWLLSTIWSANIIGRLESEDNTGLYQTWKNQDSFDIRSWNKSGVHLMFICNFIKKEILCEFFKNIYFYEKSSETPSDQRKRPIFLKYELWKK